MARVRLAAKCDPRELCLCTTQCFSQGPEDGVIAEIFRRIGARDRFFVEIGAGDGRENTTRLLLTLGWSGIWVEGSPKSCAAIRRDFAGPLASGQLRLIEAMVTAENIGGLLAEAGAPRALRLSQRRSRHEHLSCLERAFRLRPARRLHRI